MVLKEKYLKAVISFILVLAMFIGMIPLFNKATETTADAASYTLGYVNVSSTLNVRTSASTSASKLTYKGNVVVLWAGQRIDIISTVVDNWYQIEFDYDGTRLRGWVMRSYIVVHDGTYNATYAAQLRSLGFPESYIAPLCYLHSKYPAWTFKPYFTGGGTSLATSLDWETAVNNENKLHVSLFATMSSIYYPESWFSTMAGAYDWKTDSYIKYDSCYQASKELVAYLMDPRNFLTDRLVFMFENNAYSAGNQTEPGVIAMCNGTFLAGTYDGTHTYSSLIMTAAAQSGVSPYFLTTRILQEMGTKGTTGSISGTYGDYPGYYNYYNISATPPDPITNALKYAAASGSYDRPWNTREKAVIGGAKFIGKEYINRGQNTLYLQKFNFTGTSTYGHQYMGNVFAPVSEASNVYGRAGSATSAIEFSIPVFRNMPSENVPLPTKCGSPNNYLKELSVQGVTLDRAFDFTVTNYQASVNWNVESVKITATPVNSQATVTGIGTDGTVALAEGYNKIVIKVTSGSGIVGAYTIIIFRDYKIIPDIQKSTAFMVVGETEKPAVNIYPAAAAATNPALTWKSSNTKVATIDANGNITALAAGTTEITVTSVKSGLSDSCIYTIREMNPNIKRISGDSRYDTSIAAAEQLKSVYGVEKFENIVVASGGGYADALSGNYLASVKNAPMLLTASSQMTKITDYIKANLAEGGTVYVLGGTGAVPSSFEDKMGDAYAGSIVRLAGNNRYETNLKILNEAGVSENSDLLVCTGTGFADSLSASAVGKPILLVPTAILDIQKEFLDSLGSSNNIYVIGGSGVISNTLARSFTAYGNVKRIYGSDRFETAVNIAREFFDNPERVVLAYAQDFPDGLSAGALASAINAPLLLAQDAERPVAAGCTYRNSLKKELSSMYVMGGKALVRDIIALRIFEGK